MSSCSLFDSEDPIPAYLILSDEVTVVTTVGQGEPTHNIKDAWVFDGTRFLGIFPLPAKVPVILNGEEKHFSIFAGVRNNGIQGSALKYPFYKPIEFSTTLQAQEEKPVEMIFDYASNAKFDFIEDFEFNHIFSEDPNPIDGVGTPIVNTTDEVLSGISSGHIFMDTDTSAFERSTVNSYDRANNSGSFTFLEIDYKCDVPFLVGYIVQKNNLITRDYPLLVAPSEEWNKIYIEFTHSFSPLDIQRYTVSLATAITEENELPANIYLDNIKLVHF